jgi:signal transduction histidine kinase
MGALTPVELAGLIASFNEVTSRLEHTHESLRLEVARLQDELREANEQLQRSRRLAALGEMAAGIAHEVRNPLGSIRLYARMLEQDLADRPVERALAGKIEAAVRGLDAVVGDVLNFAREVRVHPEAVPGGELLERALHACAGDDPGECVRYVLRGVGALLRCDAVLMQQALVNVVRNALQAMAEAAAPAGGHILTLEAAARPGECCVSVADTGRGVPEAVLDRVFNPFFTTRKTGTGLGLAIVHRIVDAHGGRIAVRNNRSDAGVSGATVELTWPVPEHAETISTARRQDGAPSRDGSRPVTPAPRPSTDDGLTGATPAQEARR